MTTKQFLKVNETEILGLHGNITKLHLNVEKERVNLSFVGGDPTEWDDTFTFETGGKALWNWASHLDRCDYLEPNEEIIDFQQYQASGGTETYSGWIELRKQHARNMDRLDATDSPSESLLAKCAQTEAALMY